MFAVDAEPVDDAELGDPVGLFDELELGGAALEAEPDEERQHEGDERGPKRHETRVARHDLLVVAVHEGEDQQGTHKGYEDRQAQEGCIGHRRPLTGSP